MKLIKGRCREDEGVQGEAFPTTAPGDYLQGDRDGEELAFKIPTVAQGKDPHRRTEPEKDRSRQNPIPFNEHPPKYPTAGNVGITFYKGDFKNLSLETNTVQIKVWDGSDWRFIIVEVESTSHSRKLHLDDSWEMAVPTIYERDGIFYLVTAFEKKLSVMKFADYYRSKTPKVLAVALNLGRKNRAGFSLVGMNGTVPR